MKGSTRLIAFACAGLLALGGCNTGSRGKRKEASSGSGGPTSGGPSSGGPSSGGPATVTRLGPNDPGVQTGLALLRGQITAADAEAAWTADGVTPAQALDLLGRLPLTAAPGAGTHQDAITDGFGRTTDIRVVVPAAAPPAAGYPVMVFLHGMNGSSAAVSNLAQHLPDFLSVGPTAQPPPAGVTYEDAPPVATPLEQVSPNWWVYRDHAFAARALDWLRERYPIDTNRIIIAGVSMGGFGAWNVGLRLHDRFAGLVTGAGGISRLEYALGKDVANRRLLENAAMIPTWFSHGDQDTVIVPVQFSRWTDEDLTAAGVPHTYREIAGGGHDNASFTGNPALMAELSDWMNARTRSASPAQVTHRALGDYHAGAYWVELKGPGGTVQASANGAVVTVATGDGATGAAVYLDPNVVDVTAPVTVVVNGVQVFQGVPTPTLAAVARSFARTRDPQLTYLYLVE
ncbi:MAG: alpha/beta hydrolase-fold protein [Planctomycetes bacterium]|nr:alpha/beta hydrolase-fold protein [Planctomycetota bacterium]